MRHPIQGNPKYLQFRVETPYKNGHLDHLFVDRAEAVLFTDKAAAEFGMAMMFDHHYDEVMHVAYHRGQMTKNMKQFDLRGNLKYQRPITSIVLDEEVTK